MWKLLAVAFSVVGVFASTAVGQSVQLPTFHQLSTSGTVVVPDRGSVSLGGVNRSAAGSNQFGGLPGNRSFGGATTGGSARMYVQIHDFEAMDRALLEEARARRKTTEVDTPFSGLPTWAEYRAVRVPSVAEIRLSRKRNR